MTQILIALIYLYRWSVSPFLSPACRFEPTCSHYAIHALEYHGLSKGLWLIIKRMCRCHPIQILGGDQGYDPVPLPQSSKQQPIQ